MMASTSPPPDELSSFAELMRNQPDYAEQLDPDRILRRRRRRRRGLIITAVVLAVMLGTSGAYAGWALTAPLPTPVVVSQTPEVPTLPAAAVPLPAEGAAAISVSGADEYLGAEASGIWSASGTNEPRAMASISKLITALVILDAKPLTSADDPGPTITFSKADHDLYDKYYVQDASIAAMPTGSSMSQHDAFATMLIPSASNYAEALSTWAFGSQSAFRSAARRWLAAHGLSGTTIVEPTGISARNVSTPSDLLAIGKLAAAQPALAQIVATRSLSLPGPGAMVNTNDLLGTHGITGLKTGNLGEGTYNLLYTATLDVGASTPLTIVGVVLDGASRESVDQSVTASLDGIRSGFHQVPLATSGQDIGSYSTPWGSSARMVVSTSASIFVWSNTPITVTMDTTAPTTYSDGEIIGTLTWTAGSSTATTEVHVKGSIDPPTAWWRLTHPSELGAR